MSLESMPQPQRYVLPPITMEPFRGNTTRHDGPQRSLDYPDVIARDQRPMPLEKDMANHYALFTEAALDLAEHYGIDSPGIGNMIPVQSTNENLTHTWLTAQRIEGANMHDDMSAIPSEIVLETIENMVRYYEDAIGEKSDKPYLADLGLTQIIYGHPAAEGQSGYDRPILVDIDPFLYTVSLPVSRPNPERPTGNSVITADDRIYNDIKKFKNEFPAIDIAGLEERFRSLRIAILDARTWW